MWYPASPETVRAFAGTVRRRSPVWAVVAAALALAGHAQAARAADVRPNVTTRGTQFVDRSGGIVVLRGVDVSSISSQLAQIVQIGANFARVRVMWSAIEPAPNRFDASQLSALDRTVGYLSAHNVAIELDLRGRPVPQWFGSTVGFYKTNRAASQAAYRTFALEIVHRYESNPSVVGYGIFNEPQPMSWDGGGLGSRALDQRILTWQAGIRNTILAADPYRVVFLNVRGGNYGMQACFRCAGFSTRHTVVDWHSFYNGRYGSGMDTTYDNWVPSWPETHNQRSKNYQGTVANQWANLAIPWTRTRRLGIPMIVGEWGVRNDDVNALVYDEQMMRLFDRRGVSWARWDMDGNSPLGLLQGGRLNAQGLWLQRQLLGQG